MIKAVIFDFRDTLLKVGEGYEAMNAELYRFLKKHHKDLSRTRFEKLNQEAIRENKNLVSKNHRLHDAGIVFVQALFKKLGLKVSPAVFKQLIKKRNDIFVSKVTLYPDAGILLRHLKNNRIKTAVVIDGTIKREFAIIRNLKLQRFLDVIVISEQVGYNKFTPKPLKAALSRLGTNPKQTLVIGDRLDKDIVHANTLGCISVRLVRNKGRYASLVSVRSAEKPKFTVNNLREIRKLI